MCESAPILASRCRSRAAAAPFWLSKTVLQRPSLPLRDPSLGGRQLTSHSALRDSKCRSQIAYEERVDSNITTLTTTNADTLNGVIQGLLYVPDISRMPSCDAQQYDFIPKNVTRRANLPPTNYNLIALAPWFSMDCTQAYLTAARADPIRAFIFYKPNNSSNKPQDVDSPVWNLDDDGAWRKQNQYPVFAVSGLEGQKMMTQLSLYSGTVSQIPHGQEIAQLYGPNPKDYVRIWTELTMKNPTNIPALWIFFLIVIGALLFVIGGISLTMHLIQRRRRISLRRRVESGEVDLEAMGIKRLTVPQPHVQGFPLYTYNQDPDSLNGPPTPTSPGIRGTSRLGKSRRNRRPNQTAPSDIISPSEYSVRSTRSVRSKRSSITGSDTTATNFQPNCHICLDRFEHRVTIIKELPCGHIFHPDCIDEFLLENSSLCPMCKHCMLPRGYCPPITNGMVRRERALRRLRGRVDLDYSSLESGESKLKSWGRRLFSSGANAASPDVPLTPVKAGKPARDSGGKKISTSTEEPVAETEAARDIPSTTPSGTTIMEISESEEDVAAGETIAAVSPNPAQATRNKTRKPQPRALRLLPTAPEGVELVMTHPVGGHSPSSFARERMREIASQNAPFDDPDFKRPKWRRVISSVFPGFT
ncbi:ring finger domain-containing [Trichoderma arundinaceum]|uniref:Ring finger domain-containing n=1 Tax=Trichoderma arundinaceum TaxID=490622 RepID=A0A395NF38_TRIAR|nr:ring finger domain-containing [Trichoderma arundinaceum]